MNWLLWRQHRTQAFVTSGTVALFAVAALVTGVHMANIYNAAIRTCTSNGTCNLVGNIFQGYGAIVDTVHLSIALPIVLGTLLGATLIARETEHATNVLLWTQTVTRRRWLFTKVATVLAATLLTSAVVSALVTWWSGTPNTLYGNRFEGAQFDTQNVVPIAFALFAVALGIAAGAWFRRTLPAIAATVGIYAGVRVLVSVYLRPHYGKVLTRSFPLNGTKTTVPSGSWILSEHLADPAGHSLGNARIQVPAVCNASTNGRENVMNCLGRLGYRTVVDYHSAGQYWRFQWTEAAVFLVLAAVLLAFGLVRTLRRDA